MTFVTNSEYLVDTFSIYYSIKDCGRGPLLFIARICIFITILIKRSKIAPVCTRKERITVNIRRQTLPPQNFNTEEQETWKQRGLKTVFFSPYCFFSCPMWNLVSWPYWGKTYPLSETCWLIFFSFLNSLIAHQSRVFKISNIRNLNLSYSTKTPESQISSIYTSVWQDWSITQHPPNQALLYVISVSSIGCFKCVSAGGDNPSCEVSTFVKIDGDPLETCPFGK